MFNSYPMFFVMLTGIYFHYQCHVFCHFCFYFFSICCCWSWMLFKWLQFFFEMLYIVVFYTKYVFGVLFMVGCLWCWWFFVCPWWSWFCDACLILNAFVKQLTFCYYNLDIFLFAAFYVFTVLLSGSYCGRRWFHIRHICHWFCCVCFVYHHWS